MYIADLLIGCRDVCRVPGWLADGLMVMASKGNGIGNDGESK